MPVFQLDENEISFPDPKYGREDGLLAVGGDLCEERLLLAYSHGIFPWFSPEDPILWWCPMERFVIFPKEIHISRSMKKYMKKHSIQIQINRDFKDTIKRCRLKREFTEEGTWITDEMETAYYHLHKLGYACSVEAYVDGELAGGLYGVHMGKSFIGESMFSEMENGSKVALILFAHYLEQQEFTMIDCQLHTDHLESMGGRYISYEEYMKLLQKGFGI